MNLQTKNPKIQKLMYGLLPLFPSELRFRIAAHIDASTSPPRIPQAPTVCKDSRFSLENILNLNRETYTQGLSTRVLSHLLEELPNFAKLEAYEIAFPMSKLDGFAGSKANMITRPERASQASMVNFGRLVDDLTVTQGVSDEIAIERCRDHGQIRLERGVELHYDDWHRRYYWSNSGGSHHMGRLCYLLAKNGLEWHINATVNHWVLDWSALERLSNEAVIFVTGAPKNLYASTVAMKGRRNFSDELGELGIYRTHTFDERSLYPGTQFLFFDKTRRFSKIGEQLVMEGVKEGLFVPLRSYLREFQKFWSQSEIKVLPAQPDMPIKGHISK